MELSKAKMVVTGIQRQLLPHCSRFIVAGSIRRERYEVKDIEVVALAKKITTGGASLFDDVPSEETISPEFKRTVLSLGTVIKGKPEGRYMQIAINSTFGVVNLDLFLPEVNDYWRQAAVRTGCKEYARKVLAGGWNRIGWCGSDVGLRKFEDCTNLNEGKLDEHGVRVKPSWKCVNPKAELPPVWQTEEHFFEWLRIPYVEPKYRNL